MPRLTLTNTSGAQVSVGPLSMAPGDANKVVDVTMVQLDRMGPDLTTLSAAGKITFSVSGDPLILDRAEVATASTMGTGLFVSAEQTATGSAQNVAHTLGVVPSQVFIALTGGPAAYTQPTVTQGTHTATNVVATVTLNWKFRVIAFP